MIDDRSLLIVSLEVVCRSCEVRSIEEHPDETVCLELLAQFACRLEELVTIVDPCGLDEATHREDDGCLSEIVWGDINRSFMTNPLSRREQQRILSRILEIITITNKVGNCSL